MNKRCIRTVADVVKAFGGTKKTADWANTYASTVSNWLANDEIPNGWHYRIHLELTARGFSVSPKAFGIRPARKGPPEKMARPVEILAGRA